MALEPHEWNSIVELIEQRIPTREVTFAKVHKRDATRKLIWVEAFGQTAIPLVDFDRGFSYYEQEPYGNTTVVGTPVNVRAKKHSAVKPEDIGKADHAYLTKLQVPHVGDVVVILRPGGVLQFPVCIGKIQSKGHWVGEL